MVAVICFPLTWIGDVMNTFMLVADWIVFIFSTIAALAWAAWGFGWISAAPTGTSADVMVILFIFQASYFFSKIADRRPS